MSILSYGGKSPHVHPSAFVAPTAALIGDVHIGPRASVWFGAVLRADQNTIAIGEASNIQDGVVVHCDAPDYPGWPVRIGDRVTIGHGALLHGCTIEDDALVGNGSVVLDDATIGTGAVVGAHSLVPPGKSIDPHTLVVGSPARLVRTLADSDRPQPRPHEVYVDLASTYALAQKPSDSNSVQREVGKS